MTRVVNSVKEQGIALDPLIEEELANAQKMLSVATSAKNAGHLQVAYQAATAAGTLAKNHRDDIANQIKAEAEKAAAVTNVMIILTILAVLGAVGVLMKKGKIPTPKLFSKLRKIKLKRKKAPEEFPEGKPVPLFEEEKEKK